MRARALLILVIFFALLAIAFLFLPSLSESQWQLAGEISRNTNALAVLAASIAAYIAWGTNRARAKEAKRADFKDRIHWASKHYTAEPTLESIAAGRIIDQFAEDKALSAGDIEIATELANHKEHLEYVRGKKYEALKSDLVDLEELLEAGRQKISQFESTNKQVAFNNLLLQLSLSIQEVKETETLEVLRNRIEILENMLILLENVTKEGDYEPDRTENEKS